MKNILVPTDFSGCAMQAAEAGASLAKRFGATLHFVSVVSLPRQWDRLDEAAKKRHPDAVMALENTEYLLQDLSNRYGHLPAKTACLHGSLVEVLKQYVAQQGIDFMVMGSHGASGKNEYFIGSNTQKVVRSVSCPVLIVKNKMESADFRNVVFAADFTTASLEVFEHFMGFIKHFVPEIHLLAVKTSPFDSSAEVQKRAMERFSAACSPLTCFRHVVEDISVDEGIRSFAQKCGADLIAISNRERHPVKRMLIGSNVELLVNHSEAPVLTIDFE